MEFSGTGVVIGLDSSSRLTDNAEIENKGIEIFEQNKYLQWNATQYLTRLHLKNIVVLEPIWCLRKDSVFARSWINLGLLQRKLSQHK